MEPTRDTQATLVDLLDRVLDKGLVIYADIIISVAGIPLIGVNLRAALAGMETMLKYGVMQAWDERSRAWEREHRAKKEPSLTEGEEIALKMFGSYHYSKGIYTAWRSGHFYLTNQRLFLFYPDFGEVLFETPLEKVRGLVIKKKEYFTGKEREGLCLLFESGEVARLCAEDTRGLKRAMEEKIKSLGLTLARDKALNQIISKQSISATESEMDTCPQCSQEAPVKELLEKGCPKCGWVSPRLKTKLAQAAK